MTIPQGRLRRTAPLAAISARAAGGGVVERPAPPPQGRARREPRVPHPQRRALRRRAVPLEGRAHEGGPDRVLRRHQRRRRGQAYGEVYQAALASLQSDAEPMDPVLVAAVIESELGTSARGALRRVLPHADRRRVDRPGPRRPPARRHRGRGQGAVPGRRRGHRRRPGQHRAAVHVRQDRQGRRPAVPELRRARSSPTRSPSGSARSSTTPPSWPTSASSPSTTAAIRSSACPRCSPSCRPIGCSPWRWSTDGDGTRSAGADQELRDRWGEVVYRFFFGSIARFGMFNADPHPGNYLFHDDGTVTFLDFGCVKRLSPTVASAASGTCRSRRSTTTPTSCMRVCIEHGFARADDPPPGRQAAGVVPAELRVDPPAAAVHVHA